MKNFSDALRVHYTVASLSPEKRAKYWLIERYKDRVSKRLLDEQRSLYAEADSLPPFLLSLIYAESPFLSRITKSR